MESGGAGSAKENFMNSQMLTLSSVDRHALGHGKRGCLQNGSGRRRISPARAARLKKPEARNGLRVGSFGRGRIYGR
jgi:hypothetical protein